MAIRKQKTGDLEGNLHQVHVGVGEAVQRLIEVEFRYRLAHGALPENLLEERALLVEALNQFELELGFDCDRDGVPDTVEVFEESAHSGCCRILPFDTSRIPWTELKTSSKRRWGIFRRRKKDDDEE